MKLVIVESPAKIHNISKILGKDYKVAASYGHIAEIEGKSKGIDVNQNFKMNLKYNPNKNIKDMIDYAKKSTEIYLATDFDREGEKISYDIRNFLINKKYVKSDIKFYRITFSEITKKGILDALKNKHEINMNLVMSQEARSTIDYLFGFNLSPVLWYKLPGAKSAGRVQSVALRMVCEREIEIRDFISQEYWSIEAFCQDVSFKLDQFNQKKVEKFSFDNKEKAIQAQTILKSNKYKIIDQKEKKINKNPYPPFITSTLQKEAYLRFGFGVKKTMQIAQKLYEGGKDFSSLITYMRTDSFNISEDGLKNIRIFIDKTYGEEYLSKDILIYTKKVKNAQEAHEAIRVIDVNNKPQDLFLDDDSKKLYDLIWKRTVASQMTQNEKLNISYYISSEDQNHQFIASYTKNIFDGFVKVYDYLLSKEHEGFSFNQNDSIIFDDITIKQHFTEPNPRYNEASLIENLEKYGIGRPSTYAGIISTIIERDYVKLENKKLIPNILGEIVIIFLKYFFPEYVDFHFTANIEEELDNIAEGSLEKLNLLEQFWNKFNENIIEVKQISISEIIKKIQNDLQKIFNINDKCEKCSAKLMIMIGKYGPYLSCINYPECKYIKNIFESFNKILGQNEKGEDIVLKKGKYGYYVQVNDKKAEANLTKENTTLEQAKIALSFPRFVEKYKDEDIFVTKGRFGFYSKINNLFVSVPKGKEMTISLNEIINIYNKKVSKE